MSEVFGTLCVGVLMLLFVATIKLCDDLRAICDRLQAIDETLREMPTVFWELNPVPERKPKPEGWRHGGGNARW